MHCSFFTEVYVAFHPYNSPLRLVRLVQGYPVSFITEWGFECRSPWSKANIFTTAPCWLFWDKQQQIGAAPGKQGQLELVHQVNWREKVRVQRDTLSLWKLIPMMHTALGVCYGNAESEWETEAGREQSERSIRFSDILATLLKRALIDAVQLREWMWTGPSRFLPSWHCKVETHWDNYNMWIKHYGKLPM